jgi:parallel beta-helix repeat protein
LIVNGTLYARGTSNDRIVFYTSNTLYLTQRIAFSRSSRSWSDTDGSGCIIENAFFNSTTITIDSVSPKIIGNIFSQPFGTPISISNGAPLISNNIISSNGSGINANGGASVISNNSITLRGYGNGITATGDVSVFDNTISGGNKGITGNIRTVERNVISGTQFGIDIQSSSGVKIEGNLIIRNTNGIYGISSGSLVQNNTIADNRLGIVGSRDVHTTETVLYNNLRNNETDIKSWNSNINAAYNWWGTTDTRVMNQSIHDVNDDQYLGKVSYIPFLTSPNPAAPAYDSLIQTQIQPLISNQPETNPSTTPSPEPSTKKPSTITVSCFTYSNRRVGISGTLTADGTSRTGAFVLLSYSIDGGGAWTEIATVQTDDIGMFIATWVPSAGGNYRLKAS